ncbi:MAG: hypothetical protein WCJ81_01030 [bacterium]
MILVEPGNSMLLALALRKALNADDIAGTSHDSVVVRFSINSSIEQYKEAMKNR